MLPENIPPISLLDPSQREWLLARSRPINLRKGAPVYMAGDRENNVFLLTSGLVKTGGISMDGREYVLWFVTPGEFFGEAGLFGPLPNDEYAQAVEPTVISAFDTEAMLRMMEEDADFGMAMLRLFHARGLRKEQRLKHLLFASSRDRVIHVLLDLGEQFGYHGSGGLRLNIHLSHQELASMVGCSRESVTIALCKLRDDELLQIGRRDLVLTKPDKLAKMVGRNYKPLT